MRQELWQKFDQLRSLPHYGFDGLAEFFEQEGIRFNPTDLGIWGQFVVARLGRSSGITPVPEWLANVFCQIAKGAAPKSICDPWAGLGFLVEILRSNCSPAKSIALTQSKVEYEVGKVLVPNVSWHLGEPTEFLDTLTRQFDLVASILPIGVRMSKPLAITTASGKNIVLKDDLGNLVMVASSLHMSEDGIGLFVVTPSFFSNRSIFQQFGLLGLGVEAALSLPSGTFAPYSNVLAFLLIIRKHAIEQMFVAQLSSEGKTNEQILNNFRQGKEGDTLELGRYVDPATFSSFERIRVTERYEQAERRFGVPAIHLDDLSTAINLGRYGEDFEFQPHENSLFIPMIGNSDVVASSDELTLKKQNYTQVVIDPDRSNAQFVARFLNSDFGKELREQSKTGTIIPKLNKQTLKELRVFVPDLDTQRRMLEIEAKVGAEQNILLGLQNELREFQRELWANPSASAKIEEKLGYLSKRLTGGLGEHTAAGLDQWFETLPFPLASILRAWQATPSQDFKTKHEHLLHFFEATAQFVSIILLSAFSSNDALFEPHKAKLSEAMQKQNLSFQRATFGTWKLVVEYLSKQTRDLLKTDGKKPESAINDRALCADIFADSSHGLPEALSRKELAAILSRTNKMRNDWSGHGGVVGQEEAQLRNEQLLTEVQNLREVIADMWVETQLIHALHCRPRQGIFENEVAVWMGSNSESLKETRNMADWMDVERVYLSKIDSGRSLKLIPLIQVGPSPESAKNACYFFNRLERDGGARFVSYHFMEKPELSGQFLDTTDAIDLLTLPKNI